MRKDVTVEDISANIRVVEASGYYFATVTISVDDMDEFLSWRLSQGIEPMNQEPMGQMLRDGNATYVLKGLDREQIMFLKLTWGRHDIPNRPRTLG